jgi:transposase-like protein
MPEKTKPIRQRRRFTAQQKIQVVRLHLLEQRPLSDLCEEYEILPSQFYDWQKRLFENGEAAFETKGESDRRCKEFTEKLAEKDSVIAEILEEHLRLKKGLGVRS